jgi:hypothetical protein
MITPIDNGKKELRMTEPEQADSDAAPKSKYHSQRQWDDTHVKERWAQRALESALKKGLIERQPCEVCGAAETDGHHDDYDMPMKVRWLCRLHHRAVHLKKEDSAA